MKPLQVEQAVNGYAFWLEPAHLHFHHGDSARIKVLWGYAMKRDKLEQPVEWTGLVIDPEGRQSEASIAMDKDGFNYEMVFQGGPEGIYTAQVEHRAGVFYHWARVLVPFGHHVHGRGAALNRGLEIVPGNYAEFHPGDRAGFQVLFNGKPLAGARVLATYHIYDGEGFPHEIYAGPEGEFQFAFDARGHWMFQVHTAGGGEEHIATLVVPGVR